MKSEFCTRRTALLGVFSLAIRLMVCVCRHVSCCPMIRSMSLISTVMSPSHFLSAICKHDYPAHQWCWSRGIVRLSVYQQTRVRDNRTLLAACHLSSMAFERIFDHLPPFENEFNIVRVGKNSDIVQYIACHNNDISQFTFLESTKLLIELQQLCGMPGGGADRLHGCHASFGHQLQFTPVFSMFSDTRIGAHSNFHARLDSIMDAAPVSFNHIMCFGGHYWRHNIGVGSGILDHRQRGNQRWHEPYILLQHQFDKLVGEIDTMFDR